jgi:hypothetical protein
LLVWRRRREEGGLIIVNGRRGRRREDQQDERRPRGARRAPSISSFIAHFRHDARELNPGQDCGVESKPHLQRARDLLRGTCHQTTTHHPAAANLQCSLFCTTYRHHVRQWPCSSPCSHACTAEGRGLSSSDANIPPRCLLLLYAPHRSTWTRHVRTSTEACDLRSAVHTPTTPSSTLHLHLHCIASEKYPTF